MVTGPVPSRRIGGVKLDHSARCDAACGRWKTRPLTWSTEHSKGVLWNTGGMYRVELYAAVRRSVYVEGLSERAAARRFGLARETVRKMLRYRRPPGYRRAQPVRRPKLDAFTGIIDQILREDQSRPKKQRHTAKRIGER